MSITALNDNLLEMIGAYASGSAEELAHVTCTSKAFKRVAYTKIHPHLLAAYGQTPALQREVAAVHKKQRPFPPSSAGSCKGCALSQAEMSILSL